MSRTVKNPELKMSYRMAIDLGIKKLPLTDRNGQMREVGYGQTVYCKMDGVQVRINGFEDRDTVQVMDMNGEVLVDTRHPSQLIVI